MKRPIRPKYYPSQAFVSTISILIFLASVFPAINLTGCSWMATPLNTIQNGERVSPYVNPGAKNWVYLQDEIDQAEDGAVIDLTDYLYPMPSSSIMCKQVTVSVPSDLSITLRGKPDWSYDCLSFVFAGDNHIRLENVALMNTPFGYGEPPISILHFGGGDNFLELVGANSALYCAPKEWMGAVDTGILPDAYLGYGAAIGVPEGVKLTVSGSGSLSAKGDGGAAGIGGGFGVSSGTIRIDSGNITAHSGSMSPIMGGAAIGGGSGAAGGLTIISDGSVIAYGYNGTAGIGGGYGADAGEIVISGGYVEAHTDGGGAAIGGSRGGSGGRISIEGGEVVAFSAIDEYEPTNSYPGPAIGNGYNGTGGTLNVSGGTLTAYSSGKPNHTAIDCAIQSLPVRYNWRAGNLDDESSSLVHVYPDSSFANSSEYSFVMIETY